MLLPKGPGKCRFLTERENEIIRLRALAARGHEQMGRLESKQDFAAFYDYQNHFQAVIIFCLNVSVPLPADIAISVAYTALSTGCLFRVASVSPNYH